MSYELQATVREAQGTGASRRLRREGQVPAVLYGENQEAVAIALDHKTVFYALEKESFHTSLIKLALNGKAHDVIVRDFQVHPFRQQIQRFLLGNWVKARGHFIGKQQDRFKQQSTQNRNSL